MTHVPMFDAYGWTCDFQARKGHVFSKGAGRIVVRSNAAWAPGMPTVKHGAYLPARFLTVERTRARRLMPHALTGWGNNLDGGEQGGHGIVLMPTAGTLAELDGTMERMPIAAFHAVTGEPLTRADLGFQDEYLLSAATPSDGSPLQFRAFASSLAQTHPQARWQRIDAAHLIRAYSAAMVLAGQGDPVARFWLICCAHDVIRSYAVKRTRSDGQGWSLAAQEENVAARPGTGGLGIVRWNAWSLRCVVEAYRVAPSRMFADWIRRYVSVWQKGQAVTGPLERHDYASGLDQQEPVRIFGLDPRYEWCTSWQHPFAVRAVREAMRYVPECEADGLNILRRIKPWLSDVPFVQGEDSSAPWLPRYLVIAKDGVLLDKVTWGVGPARGYYGADMVQCFQEVGL